jgi:hypothetical protein
MIPLPSLFCSSTSASASDAVAYGTSISPSLPK